MSDTLSFKYTLTEDDVVRSNRAHAAGRQFWVRTALAVAVPGMFVIGFVADGDANRILIALAVGAALGFVTWFVVWPIFWTLFWLIFSRFLKLLLPRSPHIGVEYELAASPAGLAWNSPVGTAEQKWLAYTAIRETADYFLLYSGAALCFTIPKRVFADAQEAGRFRDLLRAHVPDFRGQAKE